MKGKTSDGIDKSDWNEIELLARKIVSASFSDNENLGKKYQRKLIDKLNILQKKYGDLPSILSTKADYIRHIRRELVLLSKAYEIAQTLDDRKNLTLISSSLAERYVERLKDKENSIFWLKELKKCLKKYHDDFEMEEYHRLSKIIKDRR